MILLLQPDDFDSILRVINDASNIYKGVIPDDRWKEPYMSSEELREEINSGVKFYGWFENDLLVAVMGIQFVKGTTLIRHAYVLTTHQRQKIGENLLRYLLSLASTSKVLVGTWEAAKWAISFYQKHGFRLVSYEEKEYLLRKYWSISDRQIETSVVLNLENF